MFISLSQLPKCPPSFSQTLTEFFPDVSLVLPTCSVLQGLALVSLLGMAFYKFNFSSTDPHYAAHYAYGAPPPGYGAPPPGYPPPGYGAPPPYGAMRSG